MENVALLLVEDEPILRMVMVEALQTGGFEVLEAGSGEEALSILEAKGDRIAGLATDIRLPGPLDGWQIAHIARERSLQIAVVYVTGDSAHMWEANGVPHSTVLMKPFAEAQLVTAMANLLNRAGAGSGSA